MGVFLALLVFSCPYNVKLNVKDNTPENLPNENPQITVKNKAPNVKGPTAKVPAIKGPVVPATSVIPQNAGEALNAIIPVLQAPDASGEYLIKIITGPQAAIVKNGADAKAGDSTHPGSGTYTLEVDAGKAPVYDSIEQLAGYTTLGSIVYKYEKYQPQGSNIIIDGMIDCTEWYTDSSAHSSMESKGAFNSTLTISGAFDATLKFFEDDGIPTKADIHPGDDAAGGPYHDYLIEIFTSTSYRPHSRIELTYKGEILKLNKEQLKKLLKKE